MDRQPLNDLTTFNPPGPPGAVTPLSAGVARWGFFASLELRNSGTNGRAACLSREHAINLCHESSGRGDLVLCGCDKLAHFGSHLIRQSDALRRKITIANVKSQRQNV
jgi:hypothetical protein